MPAAAETGSTEIIELEAGSDADEEHASDVTLADSDLIVIGEEEDAPEAADADDAGDDEDRGEYPFLPERSRQLADASRPATDAKRLRAD